MAGKMRKKPRARAKTGILAAPLDDFYKMKFYFHYEISTKELFEIIKPWIKENFSKEDTKAILANPDYHFSFSHHAAGIYWLKIGNTLPNEYSKFIENITQYFKDIISNGKAILAEKELIAVAAAESNVIVLSPQQRLAEKINNTIIRDLEDLEQAWMNNEKPNLDVYAQFKKHGLTGAATAPVKSHIENWLLEYSDAYYGRCEQAIEAYSHLTAPELKRRIKVCEEMILDLDKVKSATKAIRKTKTPKIKSLDKQISKLKYCKENLEYKLVSIQPIKIIGAMRLYVFNTKTKEIFEYVSSSTKGFEIKGTTILNVLDESRRTRLRKPNEFLSIVQTKSARQIDNEWKKLTTKSNQVNGRINQDCILVRSMESL